MRTFKLDNVIKKTDNEVKIEKLLSMGFVEVDEKGNVKEPKKTDDSKELKAQLEESEAKSKELEAKLKELEAKAKEQENAGKEEEKPAAKPASGKKAETKGE